MVDCYPPQVTQDEALRLLSSSDQPRIHRGEAMRRLGIRSRTTLVDYCKRLKIPTGLHWFTEEEFQELQKFRAWCDRGYKKNAYFKGADCQQVPSESEKLRAKLLSIAS